MGVVGGVGASGRASGAHVAKKACTSSRARLVAMVVALAVPTALDAGPRDGRGHVGVDQLWAT